MATGKDVVSHQLFPDFKRYLATGDRRARDVLAELARYSPIYEGFEKEPTHTPLGRFLHRLGALDVTTAYPVLLWLLGPEGFSEEADRDVALSAIESWLVRRMLTRGTTRAYNAVFLSLLNSIRESARARSTPPHGPDIRDYLAGLAGESQEWPSDAAVATSLRILPAYQVFSRGRIRMFFEALEHQLREDFSESVSLPTDLTIEHVLPQHWEANWPLEASADKVQDRLDRDQAKHRFGNLTLVTGRLNPKMSNASWLSKRATLQQFSVLRISSDIVDAPEWNEHTIAQRGERLIEATLLVWPRPAAAVETDSKPSPEAQAVSPNSISVTAGSPDPQDPSGLAHALATADEIGIGDALRRLVADCRGMGLVTRPDREGIAFASPNKHHYLFTVAPQWEEGGSFAIWRWPGAFVASAPELLLEFVQRQIGASEEKGTLMPFDVELRRSRSGTRAYGLGPAEFPRAPGGTSCSRARLPCPIPTDVLRIIEQRAGVDPVMALRFATVASALDGVVLRGQVSKNEPWYFHVRHPKFRQIVAYAHPRPGEIYVDYRLPGTHETYGVATGSDRFYGIGLTASDDQTLAISIQL